jgi:Ca2+/H+ antiporter, TMEM165/GDT1 family
MCHWLMPSDPADGSMESFLVSMLVVAIGEIGNKTQLLALLVAARFRRPVPIILGIFVATLANHAAAGAVGELIRNSLDPNTLRIGLAISFFAIALWAIKPDKMDEEPRHLGKYGVFALTVATFFLAEMGDKTQLATVALAARYDSLVAVVAGTTLGMMLADAPAVLLADRLALKISFRAVRYVSAGLFAVLGVAALFGLQLG